MRRRSLLLLVLVVLTHVALSLSGITWGLPTRAFDPFLFSDGQVWPGEKIYRLAGAADKLAPDRAAVTGADVDVDPLQHTEDDPVHLTRTDEDIAKILLRYRLYTFQPDEMITMMALAAMRPGRLQLDPRLYQYGGLFVYPVGALIKLAGVLGLIDVRTDLVFYLDHPDQFGRFYIVARLYAAAWGLLGVLVVFGIARQIARETQSAGLAPADRTEAPVHGSPATHRPPPAGRSADAAGLLAATLFTLLPVVVCMAHEAKPHLPGAVLMLCAVWFGMRALPASETASGRRTPARGSNWWWMCVCCGAAFGMVLSAWPIMVLIPLVAVLPSPGLRLGGILVRLALGGVAAGAVYLATNPYILINAVTNPGVLRSNFGNSLAMYEIDRIGEGFRRVLELTVEGATLPIVILGAVGLTVAAIRRHRTTAVLVAPAVLLFIQFVLIGAGKPAEYGRFGVFTNAALAIGAACLIASQWRRGRSVPVTAAAAIVVAWTAYGGLSYLNNFRLDTGPQGSRMALAAGLADWLPPPGDAARNAWTIRLLAEPAPYNCPPLDFASLNVILDHGPVGESASDDDRWIRLYPVDRADPAKVRERSGPEDVPRPPAGVAGPMDPGRSRYGSPETPISWANKPFVVETAAWRPRGPG